MLAAGIERSKVNHERSLAHRPDLIDELNFFVNPVAIGKGTRVFHDRAPLVLERSTAYPSGVVVNTYVRR
jgi:dihydrofolate reductase